MAYFPFYIDLDKKNCLIIGGGKVAYRKVSSLLEYDAKITLISNKVCDDILKYSGKITILNKKFELSDLENVFYVICATDNEELNSIVSSYCLQKNILVNVVDDIKKCNYIFPAIMKKGDIVIGVSTSGNSPTMAGHIRDIISETIPDFYENLVNKLGDIRVTIKSEIKLINKREKALKKITKIGLDNNGEFSQKDILKVIKEVNGEINE